MKKRTLFLAAILSMGMVSSMIATTRSSHSEEEFDKHYSGYITGWYLKEDK